MPTTMTSLEPTTASPMDAPKSATLPTGPAPDFAVLLDALATGAPPDVEILTPPLTMDAVVPGAPSAPATEDQDEDAAEVAVAAEPDAKTMEDVLFGGQMPVLSAPVLQPVLVPTSVKGEGGHPVELPSDAQPARVVRVETLAVPPEPVTDMRDDRPDPAPVANPTSIASLQAHAPLQQPVAVTAPLPRFDAPALMSVHDGHVTREAIAVLPNADPPELRLSPESPAEGVIALDDAGLGRVSARIATEDGRARIELFADQPDSAALLRNRLDDLSQALGDKGLSLDSAHVSTGGDGRPPPRWASGAPPSGDGAPHAAAPPAAPITLRARLHRYA